MEEIKRFLADGAEAEYIEACRLNDVDSKSDPESEPYRSMYKAREIWHKLKLAIHRHLDNPHAAPWMYMDAVLDLKLGANYIECEEKSTGEELLVRCLSALEGEKIKVEVCCIVQSVLNQLGILNSDRGDSEKGLEYLRRAEALYKEFVDEVGGAPWTVDDLFMVESYDGDSDKEKLVKRQTEYFESAFTHTLYYMAQVMTKLGMSEMAANYCRMTLRRQLDTRKYQPVDWAMNAATLSQYYITESEFPLARHCLASAQTILKESAEQLTCDTQDDGDTSDRVPKAWADLYRCWAKYGLALLDYSKERLYNETLDENVESSSASTVSKKCDDQKSDSSDAEDVSRSQRERFFELELTAIEDRITDKPVCVFDEARHVFKAVQSWLDAAKAFYQLDGHTSDHVEIIRDHSHLYRVVAFFEPTLERQCRMHKRRADMLDKLLKVLNRQFYLLVCRQLMFELGEIYSAMLDNKLALIEEAQTPPNEHARAKINLLTQNSIDQFQGYINSLRNSDGKLPSRFQDDDERPVLIAHFYIGRLFSKFIDSNIQKRLQNMKQSVDYYKFLVDYCRKNPEATEKVKAERDVCEEMVVLLPARMDKIRETIE